MVTTRIDIGINGKDKPYKGEPSVELVSHGEWKIDHVKGKTLCRVNVNATVEDGDKLHIDFIPDDSFLYRLVDSFCEAEYRNDEYKFKNPQLSERRPAQLKTKIKFLKDILGQWEEKLNNMTRPNLF